MIYINIPPCLLDLGFYKVHFYGIMALLGISCFYALLIFDKNKPKGISTDFFFQILTESLFIGIFSSRLLFIAENFNYFSGNSLKILCFNFFNMSNGGFSMLGSMIGIPIYLYFRTRFLKISFFEVSDFISKHVPVFQIISRLGCLGIGCCTGIQLNNNLFYSVCYLHPDSWAPLNIPLLPNPLFSIIGSIITYFILNYSKISFFKKHGNIFGTYLTMEGLSRFLVDFYRIEYDRTIVCEIHNVVAISFNQIAALIVFSTGLLILLINNLGPKNKPKRPGKQEKIFV